MAFWSHIWVIIPLESYNSWLHLHFSWYSFWQEKWIKPRPSVILNFLIEKAAEHRIFEKCMIRISFTLFMVSFQFFWKQMNTEIFKNVQACRPWGVAPQILQLADQLTLSQGAGGTVLRFEVQVAVLWYISKIETQNYDFFESYAFPYASLCLEWYLDWIFDYFLINWYLL